jgi:dienelactone hydrolase
VLAFFGMMIWATSRDPFRRVEFDLDKGSSGKISGVAVLPKGVKNFPTVFYLHDSGGSWANSGNVLRQFAELGMAAIDFDYDQTNNARFQAQFAEVLDYVERQGWCTAKTSAWVEFDRAQNTLRYLQSHSGQQPRVYVRLAGGWIPEFDLMTNGWHLESSVLLIHGDHDETFPLDETRRFEKLLSTAGTDVRLHLVPNHDHPAEEDQPLVFRLAAEFCKSKLTPNHPLPEFPKLHSCPFHWCILPAFGWLAIGFYQGKKNGAAPCRKSKSETGLLLIAAVLGMLAVAVVALRLIPPRMNVTERTLSIARNYLVAPKLRKDFETLASLPIWQGQRLQTLLTQVQLAHYTANEIVNWKVDDALYGQFVLSPVIAGDEHELNWRRELWETFYPRIRHQNTMSSAAEIVQQFLRQRVTIASGYPNQAGVESMWNGHIVNLKDFEILYTATLRSVGVPARLNSLQQTEFWNGDSWESAPVPQGLLN